MKAGFFRRLSSAVIDLVLVIVVIYLIFIAGGRILLRNRVNYFDQRNYAFHELLDAYNNDLANAQNEYSANMEAAGDDLDLQAQAQDLYNMKTSILNMQNSIDIQPYNVSLTYYYYEIINFFTYGLVIIFAILSVAVSGNTIGRKLFKIKLIKHPSDENSSKPSVLQLLLHDSILKYLVIALVFSYSIYLGFIFILFSLLVDLLLISITRSKSTVRDYLSQLQVINSN